MMTMPRLRRQMVARRSDGSIASLSDADAAALVDAGGAGAYCRTADGAGCSGASAETPSPEAAIDSRATHARRDADRCWRPRVARCCDVLYPDPVHYLAVAVGVIGAGLLVGTLFGRARWLIFIGLFLAPFLFVASVVSEWSFSGEAGERYIQVTSIEDLERANFSYDHSFGVLEARSSAGSSLPAEASGDVSADLDRRPGERRRVADSGSRKRPGPS